MGCRGLGPGLKGGQGWCCAAGSESHEWARGGVTEGGELSCTSVRDGEGEGKGRRGWEYDAGMRGMGEIDTDGEGGKDGERDRSHHTNATHLPGFQGRRWKEGEGEGDEVMYVRRIHPSIPSTPTGQRRMYVRTYSVVCTVLYTPSPNPTPTPNPNGEGRKEGANETRAFPIHPSHLSPPSLPPHHITHITNGTRLPNPTHPLHPPPLPLPLAPLPDRLPLSPRPRPPPLSARAYPSITIRTPCPLIRPCPF